MNVSLRRWPLVIVGYRRDIAHAWLDAWLKVAFKPVKGVS